MSAPSVATTTKHRLPDLHFASRTVVLGLRVAQAILAIIVLAVTAFVAHWWTHYWHASSPSRVDFLLFTAVWTLLALCFLTVVPWRFSHTPAGHRFAILAVEAVTVIFWFAGFVALAVLIDHRSCYGGVCSAAKAAAAFGGFEWVLFSATTAMATMHAFGWHEGPGMASPSLAPSKGDRVIDARDGMVGREV